MLNAHKKKLVQNRIIQFASLLTMNEEGKVSDPKNKKESFVCWRKGAWYLRTPDIQTSDSTDDVSDYEKEQKAYCLLGSSITKAVQELPEALSKNPTRYAPYQTLIKTVRRGLAPQVIACATELSRKWRSNYEELSTLYGQSPNDAEQAKLADYKNACGRLYTALMVLHEDLKQCLFEAEHLNSNDLTEGIDGVDAEALKQNVKTCIEKLDHYAKEWAKATRKLDFEPPYHKVAAGGSPNHGRGGYYSVQSEVKMWRGMNAWQAGIPDPDALDTWIADPDAVPARYEVTRTCATCCNYYPTEETAVGGEGVLGECALLSATAGLFAPSDTCDDWTKRNSEI